MGERWRTWEEPLDIEPINQATELADGRVLGENQITWSAEQIERFRSGYKCLNCLEPQEQAWPEHCPVCGYPMRTHQAEFFAREYTGVVHLGPTTTLEEERAGIVERAVKEEEARGNR